VHIWLSLANCSNAKSNEWKRSASKRAHYRALSQLLPSGARFFILPELIHSTNAGYSAATIFEVQSSYLPDPTESVQYQLKWKSFHCLTPAIVSGRE